MPVVDVQVLMRRQLQQPPAEMNNQSSKRAKSKRARTKVDQKISTWAFFGACSNVKKKYNQSMMQESTLPCPTQKKQVPLAKALADVQVQPAAMKEPIQSDMTQKVNIEVPVVDVQVLMRRQLQIVWPSAEMKNLSSKKSKIQN